MTLMQEAREFVRARVMNAALGHPGIPQDLRNRIKHVNTLLDQFTRVGDLVAYLQRFDTDNQDDTYQALTALGLKTFEEIADEFVSKYGLLSHDRTTVESLVVGRAYTSYEVLFLVGAYDPRSGGMFLLGDKKHPEAVVIKATLSGGKYPNAWLKHGEALKYYLKSREDVFGEHFQENAAILNNAGIPILAFVRNSDDTPFTFEGVFRFEKIVRQPDQTKWFELQKATDHRITFSVDRTHLDADLSRKVKEAIGGDRDTRLRHLQNAPKRPAQVTVVTTAYLRNQYVVAEVLARAAGICEQCKKPAPFRKKVDGMPYLEVHHKVQLADGGDDTVENAIALCPNCHRYLHYGEPGSATI